MPPPGSREDQFHYENQFHKFKSWTPDPPATELPDKAGHIFVHACECACAYMCISVCAHVCARPCVHMCVWGWFSCTAYNRIAEKKEKESSYVNRKIKLRSKETEWGKFVLCWCWGAGGRMGGVGDRYSYIPTYVRGMNEPSAGGPGPDRSLLGCPWTPGGNGVNG